MVAPAERTDRERADELTIDELAARTGMTTRTVRFYSGQGLLPPPVRRGRVAYYGPDHRMRLDLIRTLQDHGYTLAAIHRVLQRVPVGASPAEYAVQAAVLAPWLPEAGEVCDRAGVERRIGRRLSDDEFGYLEQIGALEPVGDASFRVSAAMLGHAAALLQLPVPTSVLRDSAETIETHATAVAAGLTEVFVRAVWEPYQRGELDSEQVVAMLSRLRPLAVQGLVGAFGRAADRAARRNLDQA